MYLKACTAYGLKEQDLFQVNDLYENKNLYMVVDNLFSLGGMVSLCRNFQEIVCFDFPGPEEVLGGTSFGRQGGEREQEEL